MQKPKIYLASKFQRGLMWRESSKHLFTEFEVISTWFNHPTVGKEDSAPSAEQLIGWRNNRKQVFEADLLFAFGARHDMLNGTMIEIGMAYGRDIPIYLVGDYPWATWTIMPNVQKFTYLSEAVGKAKKDFNL